MKPETTSAAVYESSTPAQKEKIDNIIRDLEQKIKSHQRAGDRRQTQGDFDGEDKRHGERRGNK